MQETSRRTVLKGAAWAAPVITATAAAPLMAATDVCEDDTRQWRTDGVAPGGSVTDLEVTVPEMQRKMLIWIVGGNGAVARNTDKGRGRYIHAMVDVTPGEVFILQAGGGGEAGYSPETNPHGLGLGRGGTSSFGPGGRGGYSGSGYASGGGGASAILTSNNEPLIVAGGGGGRSVRWARTGGPSGNPGAKYWGSANNNVPRNPDMPAGDFHGGPVGGGGEAGGYGWHKGSDGRYRLVATGGHGGGQSAGGHYGAVRVINSGAVVHGRTPGNAATGSAGADGPNSALGNASAIGAGGGGGGGYFGGGSGSVFHITSDPQLGGIYTSYKIGGTGGGGSSWARSDVSVLEQGLNDINGDTQEGRHGYVMVSFMC